MKLIILILMTFFCSQSKGIEIPEIPHFDIQKYLGTWYEIARLDHKFERNLDYVTAHYELKDNGKISVVNRGYLSSKDKWKEAKAYAVQSNPKNYLKVYFFPLIPGKYRVAYINEDYTLAVVSGGSLKYLWFLSRTPQITDEQKKVMLTVAESLGYDTTKLIYPKQK